MVFIFIFYFLPFVKGEFRGITFYPPNRIVLPLKNVPATAAVIKVASVAASKVRNPILDRSLSRLGARAPVPPTKIASEAKWANPHRA